MKSKSGILAILLLTAVLTACSPGDTASTVTASTGSAAAASEGTVPGSATPGTTDPSATGPTGTGLNLGALQGRPDVFGEIRDIIGNEVTLLLLVNPDVDETSGTPGMGKGRGGGADVVREYTGEELTLLIPVGTTMVQRVQQSGMVPGSGSGTGPVEDPISLLELVKGGTLKIYYYPDSEAIEKVVFQAPRS